MTSYLIHQAGREPMELEAKNLREAKAKLRAMADEDLRACRARFGRDTANAARIVSCVNALAGMNPEALPALLDACAWYLSVNSCENRAKMRAALAALKKP